MGTVPGSHSMGFLHCSPLTASLGLSVGACIKIDAGYISYRREIQVSSTKHVKCLLGCGTERPRPFQPDCSGVVGASAFDYG